MARQRHFLVSYINPMIYEQGFAEIVLWFYKGLV